MGPTILKVIALLPFLIAGVCRRQDPLPPVSLEKVEEALTFLTERPHPFGSEAQELIHRGIVKRVSYKNLEIEIDTFTAEIPNPLLLNHPHLPAKLTIPKTGFNIYVRKKEKKDCFVAMGSHYDTKHFDEFPYVGANDGGSSTAALIALAALLDAQTFARCSIELWFFDGEESQLKNWNDGELRHPAKIQDNTYGSRHLARKLQGCGKPFLCLNGRQMRALVLLDMIGSKSLQLSLDTHSSEKLTQMLLDIAKDKGMQHLISDQRVPIEDDHIPFLKRGIPALNIIDFNNLDFWHKPGDIHSTVSTKNIQAVSQLAWLLALRLADGEQ